MKNMRRKIKPVSLFLAIFMLLISMPYQSAIAAMISTEEVMISAGAVEARAIISELLAREEIQQALISRGIDPIEAQARVGSLSDAEAVRFAGMIEQLPAGGNVAWVIGLAVFVFLVLLVTDILGYTNIFPFVKKTVKE
jgi:hypothetical protein